jgi:hypothetical protein
VLFPRVSRSSSIACSISLVAVHGFGGLRIYSSLTCINGRPLQNKSFDCLQTSYVIYGTRHYVREPLDEVHFYVTMIAGPNDAV